VESPSRESQATSFQAPVSEFSETPAREFVQQHHAVSQPEAGFEPLREEQAAPMEARREVFQPAATELADEPDRAELEPAELEPMGQPRPKIIAAERAAAPEPAPTPKPIVERPAQPAWKMEPVALPSDMVMIETQSKAPVGAYEDQEPRPVRTPRARPQQPVIPDEPLQQVETGGSQPPGGNNAA